ncbi:MAG: hypothetical protein QMC93_02285 [Patescibacteria group bacterium]|nr:hypothetical protein [Patescibacteria group bacterium]
MLSYSEIKKGVNIILNKDPCEVLESTFLFKGRGHSVLQVKLKNLISSNVISKTFHPADGFEEANLAKIDLKFLYCHRGKYLFSETSSPAKRIEFEKKQIGPQVQFLKANQIVKGLVFQEKIINISLPIKVQLKVIEAPPGLRAGRVEAGLKQVILESGVKIAVPLFVKEGDIIEVNTETGEYVRRVDIK